MAEIRVARVKRPWWMGDIGVAIGVTARVVRVFCDRRLSRRRHTGHDNVYCGYEVLGRKSYLLCKLQFRCDELEMGGKVPGFLDKFPHLCVTHIHRDEKPRCGLISKKSYAGKMEHLEESVEHVDFGSPDVEKSVTESENVVVELAEWPFSKAMRAAENKSDLCGGRYIYVHDLPSMFNEDMLKECRSLSLWTDMCKFITNAGMGPPLDNTECVFSDKGWYATNQFAVDVLFSNRMKQYECLTNDSSIAAAVFVPFYAGFDIVRYLWGYNISMRDAASLDLVLSLGV